MEHCRYALVVASEKMSAMVDWTSRDTCVLFGDGACAFLLERNDGLPESFPACELYSDGKFADRLQIPAGGSLKPATSETVANREHFVRMDGRVIFKQAVQCMSESASSLLSSSHVRPEEIRFLVPHQANIRIVEAVAQNLGMKDRLYVNLQHHGNTCSASIGLALYEMAREGKLKKEDLLLLVTAGAGLNWGPCCSDGLSELFPSASSRCISSALSRRLAMEEWENWGDFFLSPFVTMIFPCAFRVLRVLAIFPHTGRWRIFYSPIRFPGF